MKLKALLLACLVAGFTASFALADDGGHGGHGKHHEHGTTTTMTATTATTTTTTTTAANACAEVELRGTLGTVAPNSFTLTVAKQNVRGDDEDDDDDDDDNAATTPAVPDMVGQTVTIAVAPDTRVSFKATGALRGPATGDAAKVKALACGTPATLTAKSVKAEAAAAPATVQPAAATLAAKHTSKHSKNKHGHK
jgi:hypothetical protein